MDVACTVDMLRGMFLRLSPVALDTPIELHFQTRVLADFSSKKVSHHVQ